MNEMREIEIIMMIKIVKLIRDYNKGRYKNETIKCKTYVFLQ